MNSYTIHDYGLSINEIEKITQWLNEKDFKKPIIIYGNNGSGKSTLAGILLISILLNFLFYFKI